jgi:glutathione S-transferase
MRQLGMPFAEEFQVFGEGSNRAAFRRFSPSGTVPCLVDGDVVVWDSLAIVEYLAERHPGVWPTDPLARAWARAAAAEMHAGFAALRSICPMNCGIRIRLHAVPEALSIDLERIDELWGEGLRRFGGPFLAGAAFSAVDAFFAPVAFRIQSYGLSLSEPCLALAERLRVLPGMVEWYTAALAEPWREVAHEAEALAVGTLLADLRAPAASPP